jgi:hypothetical protein
MDATLLRLYGGQIHFLHTIFRTIFRTTDTVGKSSKTIARGENA